MTAGGQCYSLARQEALGIGLERFAVGMAGDTIGTKKEGAIHAPVRCVSGLGLMAFRGHPKHACRPDMHA